jgi:hypothetical protein
MTPQLYENIVTVRVKISCAQMMKGMREKITVSFVKFYPIIVLDQYGTNKSRNPFPRVRV